MVLQLSSRLNEIMEFSVLPLQSPAPPQASLAPSAAPAPHILYNPSQHMMPYNGFCPPGQALPLYPNYSMPMQVHIPCKCCHTDCHEAYLKQFTYVFNITEHHFLKDVMCCLPSFFPQHHSGGPSPPLSQPSSEASSAPLEETQLYAQNPSSPSNPSTSDPSSCVLTPNAPTLYAQPLGIFEKPPPYACWGHLGQKKKGDP